MPARGVTKYLPILDWGRRYRRADLAGDALAALIVTVMLIPQWLAYALLAGMPPETGLYASILPLVAYTFFGTSAALAVGPMAVTSLLTAAAVGRLAPPGSEAYVAGALTLAMLSGLVLAGLGLLRLGVIANFLSRPVVSGFITASAVIIALSQIGHLLGITVSGSALPEQLASLVANIGQLNPATTAVGLGSIAFLLAVRRLFGPLLRAVGIADPGLFLKAGPVVAVALATLAVWAFGLDARGVAIVGEVPAGLPPLTMPPFDPALWRELAGSAVLIAIIGFVGSISVAQTFAARKRQTVDPDQELIGLGAANIASALTGGFPITGGLSRSAVMVDAGAETPACGVFTAIGIALATLTLTPLLRFLPEATLAATILVAVLSLVELPVLRRAWTYSKSDFAAVAITIVATLGLGVEAGISAGVLVSLLLFLWHSSRPHVAEVGLVPGTQHFRNILRHAVITSPHVVTLRVDESLYFANTRFLEGTVLGRVAADPTIRHVVLMCSAVNEIDMSALESLVAINRSLRDMGVTLHLSEVKGPVMDRLKRSQFLDELSGSTFLSQFDAASSLDPGLQLRGGTAAGRPVRRPAAE